MNLLWHIFLKDLRRLRLPLALWATLQLLAQLGPGLVWSLSTLTAKETEFLLYTLTGIYALSWLAAFDFAIRFIQEDSPARNDAFWRTRPISGLRLLAAKLLALILFTALAALPALLSTLVTSPTPLASASALIEVTLQTHLVLAALAIPFAALTRSYRQSLLLSVAALILIVVVAAWIHLVYDPAGTDLYQPRMTLAALIMLTATVVILINQYATGRLARSLRIAGTGTLATTLILAFWPWRFPLLQPPLPLATDEPAETRALALAYEKATLWNEAEFGPKSTRPVLNLDLGVTGFPSGHFLKRKAIYHHWQEAAAPSFRSPGHRLTPDADARVILGLLPAPSPSTINTQSQIPEKFAARLRSKQPPTLYRADLVFDLHRTEITEIPLTSGKSVSTADSEIRLLTFDPQTARLRLLERTAGPRTSLFAVFTETDQFILYNPRTGEALSGWQSAFSIPSIKHYEFTFAPIVGTSGKVIGRAQPLTDDFLRDARLVKISFPLVGTFARTVEVPDLNPKLLR